MVMITCLMCMVEKASFLFNKYGIRICKECERKMEMTATREHRRGH